MYLLIQNRLFNSDPKKMKIILVSSDQSFIENEANKRNAKRSHNERYINEYSIYYCVHKIKLSEIKRYYGL